MNEQACGERWLETGSPGERRFKAKIILTNTCNTKNVLVFCNQELRE